MQELEALATRTYQVVTNAATAGFFQNEANEQKDAANTWRRVGVAVLFVLVVVGAMELVFGASTPSLKHTAARLPIAVAGAALATYCLRESGQHRRQERLLRRREVDVSSIAAYLENIDDEADRERLKVEFAEFLFLTRESESPDDAPLTISPS
jgi:hypothetical protein